MDLSSLSEFKISVSRHNVVVVVHMSLITVSSSHVDGLGGGGGN